jgi:ubiquinone/menaquinone biosynthesis C-methylase UbiE
MRKNASQRHYKRLDREYLYMKNWLYQILIHRTTNACYQGFFDYVPNGSRLLDVGIGNGIMIEAFHAQIKTKRLKITGIDIDTHYLKHCTELIQEYQLEDFIDVCQGSAESYAPKEEGCFDFSLFCMSFMLLPDQRSVLRRVRRWLKPGGELVFTQAMFRKKSRLVDLVKPKLKYFTTVDFGRPTYEADFFALLRENGLSVTEDRVLKRELFHSQCRMIAASFQDDGRILPDAPRTPQEIQATRKKSLGSGMPPRLYSRET